LAFAGVGDAAMREVFTNLMRFGIAAPVLTLLGILIARTARALRSGELAPAALRDPRFVGFVASAVLALLGYVLGALIRGSSTVVPAHYHAAIGAVTVSFMGIATPLFESISARATSLSLRATSRAFARLRTLQPALFASGQAIFAIGFAVAGAHGSSRKVYGAEQHVTGLGQSIGLGVMGLGGLLAVSGGVLFLVLTARAGLVARGGTSTRLSSKRISIAHNKDALAHGGTHG
jgi:hypothetical protein